MTDLNLNPVPAAAPAGDKRIAVPALALDATARRRGPIRLRRRFNATRLAEPADDGFRLFRVY